MEEKIQYYRLSKDDIAKLVAMAGREGVKAYKHEQAKQEKKIARENDKVKKTKKMLTSYRRMKATLTEEIEFTESEKIELRWKFVEDLIGNTVINKSELVVADKEKKRQENIYCIQCIENAVRLYREECEKSSSDEAKRRYREMYSMYIDENETSVQAIAERENVSDKTVYKDLGIACGIMSIYLLGM